MAQVVLKWIPGIAMRINIYAEEITKQVQTVSKTTFAGVVFYGARIFTSCPFDLPADAADDSRPAITFWFRDKDTCERFADAVAGVLGRIER